MLHLVAGVLDIQNKLHHHHSFIYNAPATCAEQATCSLDSGPWGSAEDASAVALSDTEVETSPTPRDVEEAVTASGKTQLSCEVVEEVEANSLAQLCKMEGSLENQEVETRREGQSGAAIGATLQEGGNEKSVTCEGHLKPSFFPGAPSDSVLTDSGVSEMTNTESDYSDSLEQDDEDAKSLLDGARAEETQISLSPSSMTKKEVTEFENTSEASWFDQDTSDFFINANLTHDNGIVEFDPNSEDFSNWDDVRSFFEGLIERQNTELDKLANFEYQPEAHDSYTRCSSVSADEARKQKFGFSLFENEGECLLDTEHLVGPFPSNQRFVMPGASPLPAPKVIKYNFEMHDESWGHSSHEPYFDVLTGQRILSTIYEFEVSSDEDTDSVKVVDSSWHETSSEKQDEEGSVNEGQEEEKEAAAHENICGEEVKQNKETVMQSGDAGCGDSPAAMNTSSVDSGAREDTTLFLYRNSASALQPQAERREEISESVKWKACDDTVVDKRDPNVMKKRRGDFASVVELPQGSNDEGIENEDQELDNLVSMEATMETAPEHVVGTLNSSITGHTRNGLEARGSTSEVNERTGGEDMEGTNNGNREEETVSSGEEKEIASGDKEKGLSGGDEGETLVLRTDEALSPIVSCNSPSSPRKPVFSNDPANLCLEARTNSSPAVCTKGTTNRGTERLIASPSKKKMNAAEGEHHETSLKGPRGKGKDYVIPQTNEDTTFISKPIECDRGTSRSVVSSVPYRPADAPPKHSLGMQEKEESRTENNKSSDEATPTHEPFTCPSPEVARDLKRDEARLVATDTLIEEPPEGRKAYELPAGVLSSEENITKPRKHIEGTSDANSDKNEQTETVHSDEDANNVTPSAVTRDSEPPPRPHRKTHHLNAPESGCRTGVSPPQLTTESGGGIIDEVDVTDAPASAPGTSAGVPVVGNDEGDGNWGVPGSSQGHLDKHTPGGDGRDHFEEENEEKKMMLRENLLSSPYRKELEEEEEVNEGSVKATPTLVLQQQHKVTTHTATTTTTTNTVRTQAKAIFPSGNEVPRASEQDVYDYDQRKPAKDQASGLSTFTYDRIEPEYTAFAFLTHTSDSTIEVSPQKPKRSSRTELRKERIGHVHAHDSEGGYGGGPSVPPPRPARRKQTSAAIPRVTTKNAKNGGREKEDKLSKDSARLETAAAKPEETQTGESTLDRTGAAKQGSEETEEEEGGNESRNRKLSVGATEPEEREPGTGDSALETGGKIHQNDGLDGGDTGAERKKNSDSGSGWEAGKEGGGSSGYTLSTQEPRSCALLAANTNSLDDVAHDDRVTGTPAGESGSSTEGQIAGIMEGAWQDENIQVSEKAKPMCVEQQTAAETGDVGPLQSAFSFSATSTQTTLEGRKPSKDKTDDDLSPVLSCDSDDRSDAKVQTQRLHEEAEAKTMPPPMVGNEGHVLPPRRRRKMSHCSLGQEDAAAEPDTGQTPTLPIPPVRRKRQFSSLPRSVRTKAVPRDIFPSLSTSALALTSTTEHEACTSSLRPASSPQTPASESCESLFTPEPAHSGVEVGSRSKVETDKEEAPDLFRRMSEGSMQEERTRRTTKRTVKRTGSLKEKIYTTLQRKMERSPRGRTDDGPKIKYFSKIFNRKQKLYDMSGESQYPSEIPTPASPPEHLSSENTETFATLLTSYFSPDAEDQGNVNGDTRSRYTMFERSPFEGSPVVKRDQRISPERASQYQDHLTATHDSEKMVLLQDNLVSSSESVQVSAEGNTNEGFVHNESDVNSADSSLDRITNDSLRCHHGSDHDESISSLVVVPISQQDPEKYPEESYPRSLQEDSKELQQVKELSEATLGTENEEARTPDDRPTSEATEEDEDLAEVWKTFHRDHDHCISGENENTDTSLPPPSPPPPPPPPSPPTDEAGHEEGHEESNEGDYEQKGERESGHKWERPTVSLRTWAERQGIKTLTLPPLRLRAPCTVDLEALDYYYDSDSSQERDTPSPGPPVDPEKEGRQGLLEKQKEEDRTQKDRCVEVYPETVRQRQRNTMDANKVDIQNWESSNNNNSDSQTSPAKSKKFLPSVKALRNQFESGKTETNGITNGQTLSLKSSSSLMASTSQGISTTTSLHSPNTSMENLGSSVAHEEVQGSNELVEPIFNQFRKVDQELQELMSKVHSTSGWDPRPLLKRLYYIPDAPRLQSQGTTYVNIEGYLEKLPSGRKKATFWNAWKRRYFMAKNGILYYYQSAQSEKPNMKMTLMGGKVECMEPNMVGVDDGKGHYVVVRCSSRQEAERWCRALETHTVEDFASQYVQPWPIPTNPELLRDTLIVDIGSASVRAGVLASQATLPQVFIPSVVASGREGRGQVWGVDAFAPDVRANSSLTFPIRPTHKISKYSVDLSAVSSLLQKTFTDLKVDPKNYHVQLSVPRVLNTSTQAELLRVLFDKFGIRSVNLTHQSILALYAYNATSGIVVDVGERMDVVPVTHGYIVDGGVSRVPYGGYRILDHLRQFLYMRNVSLINEVESYIIRQVLENICYSAHHYNTEKARCTKNPENFEKSVSLTEYFSTKDCPYESISLDFGRFQATEGLFNPDAWGLDHPGLHKLVHKAIMECSMDIRKEMSRSIFLAGGVTQLPGFVDRLTTELDNLTPPAIRPKVHASPYRYHAAYIGACVLADSPAFTQSRITREDWNKHGNLTLQKWSR